SSSACAGVQLRLASRSEALKVAVDFSPRKGSIVVTRRGATVERHRCVWPFRRRSARRGENVQTPGAELCAPRDSVVLAELELCAPMGVARTVAGNSHALWRGIASWGLACRPRILLNFLRLPAILKPWRTSLFVRDGTCRSG